MSNTYGETLHLTIFGESHSGGIGMVLDGLPAGERIDESALAAFCARRAPGSTPLGTPRREGDLPEFLSGMKNFVTEGTPIAAVIRNTNTRSQDYEPFKTLPRPGHADYTAQLKYHGAQDVAGGGHFSGRLTAPLTLAGGICLQILARRGITVLSRIAEIGGVCDEGELLAPTAGKDFPTVSDEAGARMRAAILAAREEGDSVGGIVECRVLGLPGGLGEPMFGGMENKLAQILFAIPAVKGVEFGAGFAAARMRGSENNDAFAVKDGRIVTETNHAGGILGGITSGMPLTFRVAFKPTPSIAKAQQSVNLQTLQPQTLEVTGRHDPCVVLRAVPVVEAASAVAVLDALLGGI